MPGPEGDQPTLKNIAAVELCHIRHTQCRRRSDKPLVWLRGEVIVLDVFSKKTETTPTDVITNCRRRLAAYRASNDEGRNEHTKRLKRSPSLERARMGAVGDAYRFPEPLARGAAEFVRGEARAGHRGP